MLGGVAGGLGEYSGIDPLLWRIGFVALTVAGGSGVLVYLLLWLLMPGGTGGRRIGAARGAERAPAGPRSPVTGVTLAAALIVVGALVLLSRLTGWDLGVRVFLGAALLVVGGGLIVSAVTGGRAARGGLITLGIALSIALSIASFAPFHGPHGNIGDRTYHPLTAAEVRGSYDGGVGNVVVDLADVDLAGAPTPIRTHVDGGIGNVRIVLPASADVQVSVDDGIGDVDVLGAGSSDGYYAGSGTAPWTGDGKPEFVLTVDAGIGNVEVSRG
jgi:phage shock protein PspC (stress-responsive transcriptional regulator)